MIISALGFSPREGGDELLRSFVCPIPQSPARQKMWIMDQLGSFSTWEIGFCHSIAPHSQSLAGFGTHSCRFCGRRRHIPVTTQCLMLSCEVSTAKMSFLFMHLLPAEFGASELPVSFKCFGSWCQRIYFHSTACKHASYQIKFATFHRPST